MAKSKPKLTAALRRFVEAQKTIPVSELMRPGADKEPSDYGNFWYRAVAAMLLAGRVKPRADDQPNLVDLDRVCVEAHFNQFLFRRVTRFLLAAEVIQAERRGVYSEGPRAAAFWAHGADEVRAFSRAAVVRLAREEVSAQPKGRSVNLPAGLIDLLALFFSAFRGLAVRDDQAGRLWREFAALPADDLAALADGAGVPWQAEYGPAWAQVLDARGQKAVPTAVYLADWAWYAERPQGTGWLVPSPLGLAMLGLDPVPPAPRLPDLLKAQSDLSVFAGSGLPLDRLVPLFRHARIKRIAQVFEFQLDRKRLALAPEGAAEELRRALGDEAVAALPDTVADVLGTHSALVGSLGIRSCSALVKPENAQVLRVIREHPQLKNYLETRAPPGYLILKCDSRPDKFVFRCRQLGLTVQIL